MSEMKIKRPGMALSALVIGVASVPVAAFGSIILGLIMMTAPIFMIYKAS